KGKPVVAVGEFVVPAHSPNLIESKSLKLYLNSFNNSRFASLQDVENLMGKDLSAAAAYPVEVRLQELSSCQPFFDPFSGSLLDGLDIECSEYDPKPSYLHTASEEVVEEALVSHLLKSNCLVTGQPDWGSVRIRYKGKKIDPSGM